MFRFWPIKFLLFIAPIIGSFFIPNTIFYEYWKAALFFSSLFILIQSVFLVSFAHVTSERWVARFEESDKSIYKYLLIGTSFILYAVIISITVILYSYYPGNQSESCHSINNSFISINLVLVLVQSILSISAPVQEANPRSGLLQSAIISFYTTYLALSAVINGECVGSFHASSAGQNIVQSFGIILTLIAVVFTAVSNGSGDIISGRDSTEDDETEGTAYNYSFFHLVFVLASFYIASVLTNVSFDG